MILRVASLFLAALGVCACSSTAHDDDAKPDPSAEKANPCGVEYPLPPYGATKGSTLPCFRFQGWVDPSADSTALVPIELGDFYNPTGDGSFAEGSPYGAGTPKPKALLIDVASSWCGPCQKEAAEVLPGKYADLHPRGAEFLLQLADGPTTGKAATDKDLRAWTKKFKVNYPATVDPAYQLSASFDSSAFPANLIIDTRTMAVAEIVTGAPSESFWTTFDAILAAP